MKKMKLLILCVTSISTLFIWGCKSENGISDSMRDTTVRTEGVGNNTEHITEDREQSAESGSIQYTPVEIQNGERIIVFEEMPQKVFCANLYSAENMALLGLEDYIVGKNVKANDAEVPMPEIADKLADIPEVEKSHENVVALGTDFIIGQVSAFKDNSWGTYEMLAGKNIKSYTISGTLAEDETIENVYEDIENLGKIFKVEDRAAKLIEELKGKAAKIQEAVSDVEESERVRVFVMDSYKGNEIYTTSKGLESNLIELAGGINVTRNQSDSRWFHTSVETIVESDPDIIIFNDYGTQTMEEKIEFIKNNPALSEVKAVKNKSFVIIPLVEVMQNARAVNACETFAKDFYPKRFQ
jgi:iron complex transport system substrate-binding protein